ncbi:MAG: peptide chain release factor aRF-1 [Candidatus Hermodarchaeota archaeon]
MSTTSESYQRFRLKKVVDTLAEKKGLHTELITLYIPPERQMSDVLSTLRTEYGTATNIKSKSTRKNVMDAIQTVIQRLKIIPKPPPNGLAVFAGAIPHGAPGSEKMEIYLIEPPEPVNVYIYRCAAEFWLDPLREMLTPKDSYGLISIDRSAAAWALLRGTNLQVVKTIKSGIMGKHRAGGQSQRRFERLIEQAAHEFLTRSSELTRELFEDVPDLRGIIIGGPGFTKEVFSEKGYLTSPLKDKVLAVLDTAYSGEEGIRALVEKSGEILRNQRLLKEKRLVQHFLGELARDTGRATYGEKQVREALDRGAVEIILVSEGIELSRVTINCSSCGHNTERTLTPDAISQLENELANQQCTKCQNQTLQITESQDLIEELGELSNATGAKIEIISPETEEGKQLLIAFRGIGAILRWADQA